MKFSKREIKDLFIAWFVISIAFAVLFTGADNLVSLVFIISLIISGITSGIGFLLHELMHKYYAQKYNLEAEFRASYGMLFLALGFSFLGFIFAAPGAVFISGRITKERNGKISLAGPMTNIVLAFLFLLVALFASGLVGIIGFYGLFINSLLALFNLLPFAPFDGGKVIAWSKTAYFSAVILALVLFVSRYFIF